MRSCGMVAQTLLAYAFACLLLGCDSYQDDLLSPPRGCGDGRVTAGELCDAAIAPGEDGACPTACQSDDPCMPQTRTGSDCRVRCEVQPIEVFAPPD